MTMLHHAVAEHLGDLFEGCFSLLPRLSDGTIVSRAISDVALHLGPEKFNRLHLWTEGWSVDERMMSVVHQLLDDGAVVIGVLIQPLLNCRYQILLARTTVVAIR